MAEGPAPAAFGGRADYLRLGSTGLSLAIVALAGIVVSALLARNFGAAAVGQFNQLMAIQLVVSQLAAFGIHLSCLHFLAPLRPGTAEWAAAARAALLASVVCGGLVTTAMWLLSEAVERVLDSPGLAHGVRWVALSILLFGVNKVLMALLNIADRIHALALMQAARPLAWLVCAGLVVSRGVSDAGELGLLLLWGEVACLVCGLTFLTGPLLRSPTAAGPNPWLRRHLRFGWRAMPSHLIADLNTRIDVLVLGAFASDAIVGIYSAAALLAEGVFQLSVLIRTVVTRRLALALVDRDMAAIAGLRRSAGGLSLAATLAGAAVVALAFRPAIELLRLDPALATGWPSLLVLLAGVLATSWHSPLWMTLVLAGQPAAHTRLMVSLLAINLVLALSLVPLLGAAGAACATAAMLAAFPFLLGWASRRSLGIAL